MSDLVGFRTAELADFPGQRSFLSDDDLPASQGAVLARNVEFFDGRIETRRGFADAFSFNPSPVRVEHMRHWLMPDWSRLMVFIPHASTPSVRYRDLGSSLEDDVVTGLASTVTTADFQEYGSRMFMAFIGDDGLGKARPRVWNGLFSSTPIVDSLFQAPPVEGSAFSASYTEPSAGSIDAGVHMVGLLFETRNGFTAKAIALNTAFTASGAKNLQITLTPVGSWSASWFRVRALITTVQNPKRYWIVPSVEASGFGGTSSSVLLTVDISDTTLASLNSEDSEATDYFSIYAYGDNGVNLDAKALVSYSGRMCYVVDYFDATSLGDISRLLISEVGDPQQVTLDQHEVRLPSNLPITTAAPLHNQLFIFGPTTIHSIADNFDKPATWGEPQLVDSRVGTPCIHGLGKDPSRNILWIANPKGLWPFDGAQIPDKPTSYLQHDQWERINWDAPKGALKVLVDGSSSRVLVVAPLDAETVPTTIFTWNYRNGVSYQRVDFASMDFSYAALDTIGGAAIVVDNDIPELWLANRTTANEVQRQKSMEAGDSNILGRDGASSGYTSEYRSGNLPRVFPELMNHHAVHLNVEGSGDLVLTAYAKGSRTKAMNAVTLEASPSGMALRRMSLKSESLKLGLSNGGVANSWWRLSYLRLYYKEWAMQR